ncbi:MAG: LysM peptidoglycan-binding domain-containing protein [Myxococcota bacterium]|nr:LysM peptidoglycan-binding domain-containing protein [Myxococcota bacterium]
MIARWRLVLFSSSVLAANGDDAHGFTHIVREGETLAQIADHVYGDAKHEALLVGANALDTQGGTIIAAGMRLEVPAPGHHTVVHGETWADVALAWLGTNDIARTELLARANKGVSWVSPVEGKEIEIPAVVTYIAGEAETVNGITQRFWGNANRGWELNAYNRRQGLLVRRGELVLVPMVGLKLTASGKAEARDAAERDGAGRGMALEQQHKADTELPLLLAEVRYGRYAEAIARGNRMLGGGALTHPQLALTYRALLEAYVAIDARSAAAVACAAWQANDANPKLDPLRMSPKILAACDTR